MARNSADSLKRKVSSLLEKEVLYVKTVLGGANSQTYKVGTRDASYFVKIYPSNLAPVWNKFNNEHKTASILTRIGMSCTPKIKAFCEKELIIVFQYIDGSRPLQIHSGHIKQAISFIEESNKKIKSNSIKNLPYASESADSIIGLYNIIRYRLINFEKSKNETQRINSLLSAISTEAENTLECLPQNNTLYLDRNLFSLSDFGFHNTILNRDKLYFIDYEYAGLDSSCKIFCDFFSQPQIPVPLENASFFLNSNLFQDLAGSPAALLSAYKLTLIKWTLIHVNDFLVDKNQSRSFAFREHSDSDINERLNLQVKKATAYFNDIDNKVSSLNKILRN